MICSYPSTSSGRTGKKNTKVLKDKNKSPENNIIESVRPELVEGYEHI